MARVKFKRWQRVRMSAVRDFSVPQYTEGRVVKVDTKRSTAGFFVCVAWAAKLGKRRRHTWAPEQALEAI